MDYKLKFPPPSHVHLVFNVSCLKKLSGEKIPVWNIFPKIDEEGKMILEPEKTIKTWIKKTKESRNYFIPHQVEEPSSTRYKMGICVLHVETSTK
jgi:hypothetical protein